MANVTEALASSGVFDQSLSKHLPAATAGFVFILFAWLAQSFFKNDPLANVPVVGGQGGAWKKRKEFAAGKGSDYYIEGYRKVSSLDYFALMTWLIYLIVQRQHLPR